MQDIQATLRTIKGAIEDTGLASEVVAAVEAMRQETDELKTKLENEQSAHKDTADDYAQFRADYDGLTFEMKVKQEDLEARETECAKRENEILEQRIILARATGRGEAMEEALRIVFRNTAVKREVAKSHYDHFGSDGQYHTVDSGHSLTEREAIVDDFGNEDYS